MKLTVEKMKLLISLLMLLSLSVGTFAQPRYQYNQMNLEKLNRGVVAVRNAQGQVYVTWRLLRSDAPDQSFEVYRNGEKISGRVQVNGATVTGNEQLSVGGTCFVDEAPLPPAAGDVEYRVTGGGIDGSYVLKADAPVGYLPIALDKPADGNTPDGRTFSYSPNDASVGDVDGDGQYEIILKWDPSNAHDNSHDGFTGSTLFDCYRLDGTRLWRIDLGRNIRSGAHYVPFLVYDFDGDGKAELMVKTADGTVDGLGRVIGNADADYREGVAEALANKDRNKESLKKEQQERDSLMKQWQQMRKEGKRDMPPRRDRNRMMRRNYGPANAGRILTGPEYLTVFSGTTGEALATVDYVPERGELSAWGDSRGNRSERYLAAVAYLDGKRASAVFCRGYYTRTVLAAWDWDGKKLQQHWVFDTNNEPWKDYAGQGNHNLRVADVDGDGCDEIIYGSMAVDHQGHGLYNTGMGHGDALHLTAFSPDSDKLQVWQCHENRRDGSTLRDAATGEIIFQIKSKYDVGRCMAADIDPENPGWEMWSSDSKGIRNVKGEKVMPHPQEDTDELEEQDNEDNTALYIRGVRVSTNFGVWWDGDLLRELLDHETVSKYDWTTGKCDVLYHFDGCKFNNGTKSNPCLSADILGDWREEVLVRTEDNSELRLYVSTIPTAHRITCLMQDIPYRLSVATENVGYNQPPETGMYMGEGAVK